LNAVVPDLANVLVLLDAAILMFAAKVSAGCRRDAHAPAVHGVITIGEALAGTDGCLPC